MVTVRTRPGYRATNAIGRHVEYPDQGEGVPVGGIRGAAKAAIGAPGDAPSLTLYATLSTSRPGSR